MIDPDVRIRQLEAELVNTKAAAVGMMAGLCFALAPTAEEHIEFARWFDAAAADPDVQISELARMVAQALKEAADRATTIGKYTE